MLVALGAQQCCVSERHYFGNIILIMTIQGDLNLALARENYGWVWLACARWEWAGFRHDWNQVLKQYCQVCLSAPPTLPALSSCWLPFSGRIFHM